MFSIIAVIVFLVLALAGMFTRKGREQTFTSDVEIDRGNIHMNPFH